MKSEKFNNLKTSTTMRTIQEIKDQLFLVSVKERMCDNIQERSKIAIELCSEKHAPHFAQLCKYLNCTERQANLLAKMPVIRLADTAEEIAKEKRELLDEMRQIGVGKKIGCKQDN